MSRHIAVQQPIAVLGESCGIPHRILDAEPDKPAKQQIIVDPFDQLPFRADRIERLQQQRAHQPLRRDRLPAERRIELFELARQRFERRIRDRPNHPQRVIRTNSFLKISRRPTGPVGQWPKPSASRWIRLQRIWRAHKLQPHRRRTFSDRAIPALPPSSGRSSGAISHCSTPSGTFSRR